MKFKYKRPQNGYPEWNNNPQIVSLNMNKPHNDFVSYETKSQAMEGIKENRCTIKLADKRIWHTTIYKPYISLDR